jgi:glycosyltransferase involved in cell wall biosynthesis
MEYSVVIPVYNSEDSLKELTGRIVLTLQKTSKPFEIIFIDDFSLDQSWNILKQIKAETSECVKIIRFSRNYGQHNATLCGLEKAKGRFIITIDDDLQNAPEDILLLIHKIESSEADVVYGIGNKNHSKKRRFSSLLWKQGAKYLDNGLGNGSSFRILKAELRDGIILHKQEIIFIDKILQWYTQSVEYVNLKHYPRVSGKSGYSGFKLWRFMMNISFNYGIIPLKIMTVIGVILFITSIISGFSFAIGKLFFSILIPKYLLIILVLIFCTSLILITLGLVGKYISNIFLHLKQKPSYNIKEIKGDY